MAKSTQVYYIPSAIDKSVSEVILSQLSNVSLQEGLVNKGEESLEDLSKIRSSKIKWLNTDSWIAGMMAHFVHCANVNFFKYDLFAWSDYIQYTVYEKGDYYKWHLDIANSQFSENMCRKLSISLCLSSQDDYEGGELQIMPFQDLETLKMDCGDAVIFSSDVRHRVLPVKSGKRISLVGWYGGPPFR